MKRYSIGCPGCGSPNPDEIHSGHCREEMDRIVIKETINGEWVRYEDVLYKVHEIEGRVGHTRCDHTVHEQTAKWHRYHRRREPNRCRLEATISFDGKNYCRRHAGIEALKELMAESVQKQRA